MESLLNSLTLSQIEQVFDGLGDVVFCVKGIDFVYQSVNLAFVERVGLSEKQELIGRRAGDIFEPAFTEIFEAQDRQVFEERRPIQDQLERIGHQDGSFGWYLGSKFPLLHEDGTVNGLVGISQHLNWPRESDLELANLLRVVEHIHDSLDQTLRTEQLALQFGLSAIQLDRRMKRIFRLSTKKFILKCRLEKATQLLKSSSLSISEIAVDCGFHDQSSLTRHFRAATSDTPASFRKKSRP